MVILIAVLFNWLLETTDIKSAFLQGDKLERKVFVEPPPEYGRPGIVWRLNKCLYGLYDAARQFYNSVKTKLSELGCVRSKFDPALFLYYSESRVLHGFVLAHVDDFLHAGSEEFNSKVMVKLREHFVAGKVEHGEFDYIGFRVIQDCFAPLV